MRTERKRAIEMVCLIVLSMIGVCNVIYTDVLHIPGGLEALCLSSIAGFAVLGTALFEDRLFSGMPPLVGHPLVFSAILMVVMIYVVTHGLSKDGGVNLQGVLTGLDIILVASTPYFALHTAPIEATWRR